jgi:cell division cycle protein 20 (cofactor of APC complex)
MNMIHLWQAAAMMTHVVSLSHFPFLSTSQFVEARLLLSQHRAAVKALGWCPFRRDLPARSGGTFHRIIKFLISNNVTILNKTDTGSQVCLLLWSKHQQELVSSHGFTENQLILWQYPTMTKVKEVNGHMSRVLLASLVL